MKDEWPGRLPALPALPALLRANALEQLGECNALTARFQLSLSRKEMEELVDARFRALRDTGRLEFGEGVLKKLIYAFCDSPYLTRQNYAQTLTVLQDLFYEFKNESGDLVADDELIAFMRKCFDGRCQGSADYMADLTLEDLCRGTRYAAAPDEPDPDDEPLF